MSSKPVERARGSFSLHLNLWYSAVFILTAGAVFLLAYFILASVVQQRDRDVLQARLDEYRAWFESGGLALLKARFEASRTGGVDAFFVRLASQRGQALFLSVPESWRDFDLRKVELNGNANPVPWYSLENTESRHRWLIASMSLRGGLVLQTGMSTQQTATLLWRFRLATGVLIVGVVVLGYTGGAFFTRRALRPIRQLIDAVRGILHTGRMDARVPARASHDELDELVGLFNQMLARNDTLIHGMREALDNVAHDLRTPIARFRASAESALQSPDPASQREALADAIEESERLLMMLKTIMDVSEAETGTMKLDITEIAVPPFIDDIIDLYSFVAEDKRITIAVDMPTCLELRADRTRIQQCLANLLDNAIKYTPADGNVTITARAINGEVTFSVRDTGVGIPPEEQPRIWDRLYRGDKSRGEKGLGLGLSLVRAIVQAHHGRVTVQSGPGQGSAFEIRLPQNGPDITS